MKEVNQDTLLKLAVPAASMGAHQAQLRQALFAVADTDDKTIESIWRSVMSKKKLLLSGATLAILLAVGLTVGSLNTKSSTVYAEQLTQQSLHTVSALPASQQQAVNKRVGGNAEEDLQAAEQAKNLTVLTYAEFSADYPNQPSGAGVNLSSLKFLRYTDASGAIHTIGVNAQDVPVFVMTMDAAGGPGAGTTFVAPPSAVQGADGMSKLSQ